MNLDDDIPAKSTNLICKNEKKQCLIDCILKNMVAWRKNKPKSPNNKLIIVDRPPEPKTNGPTVRHDDQLRRDCELSGKRTRSYIGHY